MKIEHFESKELSAGLVEATLKSVEDVSNDFGDSVLFSFDCKDKEGNEVEDMRLYCSAIISSRSKLGKLVKGLGVKDVSVITETKNLEKLIGKKTVLHCFQNSEGYQRLKLAE
tara:strand:+ start:2270 stop:2608 length:339 start_codon:yes stop_codon:yes gene_type:complete